MEGKKANNNNIHILVDLNEAARSVIDFIGTPRYHEIISALENNAQAGFTAGLSFALCLAMANCKTFLYRVEEEKSEGDLLKKVMTDGAEFADAPTMNPAT